MPESERTWSLPKLAYEIGVIAGSFALFASVIYVAPGNYFLQDLSRNFAHYTLLVHAAVIVCVFPYCLRRRLVFPVLIQVFAVLCYLPVLLQFYGSSAAPPSQCDGVQRSFSILSTNIYGGRASTAFLRETISRLQPDVIGLIELPLEYPLVEELSAYPYRLERPQRNAFGLGLYARTPFSVIRKDLGDDTDPAFLVTFKEFDLHLALVHIIAPISTSLHYDGYLAFRRMMTFVRNECARCILAGDLNTGPFTLRYQQLLRIGTLQSVMVGRGIQATWHVSQALLHLPLDHILYKGISAPVEVERIPVQGSDHDALFARFSICILDN